MNVPLRAVALLCLALSFPVAQSQSSHLLDKAVAANMKPGQLKQIYLACDLASSRARLQIHEAMNCSVVHEELKQRVFGGDFDQMLAWWKAQRVEAARRTTVNAAP
jgi:hypothetical protein